METFYRRAGYLIILCMACHHISGVVALRRIKDDFLFSVSVDDFAELIKQADKFEEDVEINDIDSYRWLIIAGDDPWLVKRVVTSRLKGGFIFNAENIADKDNRNFIFLDDTKITILPGPTGNKSFLEFYNEYWHPPIEEEDVSRKTRFEADLKKISDIYTRTIASTLQGEDPLENLPFPQQQKQSFIANVTSSFAALRDAIQKRTRSVTPVTPVVSTPPIPVSPRPAIPPQQKKSTVSGDPNLLHQLQNHLLLVSAIG